MGRCPCMLVSNDRACTCPPNVALGYWYFSVCRVGVCLPWGWAGGHCIYLGSGISCNDGIASIVGLESLAMQPKASIAIHCVVFCRCPFRLARRWRLVTCELFRQRSKISEKQLVPLVVLALWLAPPCPPAHLGPCFVVMIAALLPQRHWDTWLALLSKHPQRSTHKTLTKIHPQLPMHCVLVRASFP